VHQARDKLAKAPGMPTNIKISVLPIKLTLLAYSSAILVMAIGASGQRQATEALALIID
jgi:hypothetical protein